MTDADFGDGSPEPEREVCPISCCQMQQAQLFRESSDALLSCLLAPLCCARCGALQETPAYAKLRPVMPPQGRSHHCGKRISNACLGTFEEDSSDISLRFESHCIGPAQVRNGAFTCCLPRHVAAYRHVATCLKLDQKPRMLDILGSGPRPACSS